MRIRSLFAVLSLVYLLAINSNSQGQNPTTVSIDEGDTSSFLFPFNSGEEFWWSSTIYLQKDIGIAGKIVRIGFYLDHNPLDSLLLNQRIYARHTNDSYYGPNNFPILASCSLVYEGPVTLNHFG